MTKLGFDEIVTPVMVPVRYETGMIYGLTYDDGTTKVTGEGKIQTEVGET